MIAALPPSPPVTSVVIEHEVSYSEHQLASGAIRLVARHSFDEGRIITLLDSMHSDYHVDATEDYDPAVMRLWLQRLERIGYTPIPEDECPAEILENGSVRIYLTAERGALIL